MTPVLVALLLCAGPAPGDDRACPVIATYDSHEECRIAARSVRIAAKGARLLCRPAVVVAEASR